MLFQASRRLFVLALLWLPLASHAEVNEKVLREEYLVRPIAGLPLLAALDNASPVRQDGKVFHAYTDWHVKWHYRWWEEADGRCRITRVTTSVLITITLPSLQNTSEEMQALFNRYRRALEVHEQGHVDTGKMAAKTIESAILKLPEKASCAELSALADSRATELIEEYKLRDVQYDTATQHGRSQGAWLER